MSGFGSFSSDNEYRACQLVNLTLSFCGQDADSTLPQNNLAYLIQCVEPILELLSVKYDHAGH